MKKLFLTAAVAALTVAAPAGVSQAQDYYYPVKVSPTLSLKVKPKRDKKAPFKYTASGKVGRKTAAASAACKGTVTIRIKRGSKTVASGKAKVKSSCTYSKKLTAKKSKLAKTGKKRKLKVTASFGGNSVLKAKSAKSVTVRYR